MKSVCGVLVAILALPVLAAAEPARRDTVAADFGNDRFVAGARARIDSAVSGDAIAAGGHVALDAAVAGDALLAGGNVRVDADVGGGVYVAGGQVALNGAVGRNVRAAGGSIELGPKAKVTGNVTVAGGELRIEGPIKGYLQVAGGRVTIDAAIDGDVTATTRELVLGPNARLGGKLRYAAAQFSRDPAAQVAGPVEESKARIGEHRRLRAGGGWLWTAGLTVLAAVIAGAIPAFSTRVGASLRAHPWLALLFGFIAFVCIPAGALILIVTIVGLPIALLALLLYFALLLLGYVTTAVALGEIVLRQAKAEAAARAGWRILAAVVAVLVLALLARIPYVGGLVVLAAILFGMGTIALAAWRAPPEAAAT